MKKAPAARKTPAKRPPKKAVPAAPPSAEPEVTGSPAAEAGATAAAPVAKKKRPRKGAPGKRPRRKKRGLLDDDEFNVEDSPAALKRRRLAARKRARRKKLLRRREQRVKPSPPLQETDPLGAYLAGEQVPCPVGCGGFSEVVRIGTLESGAGEVWFECLSCAQRRMFEVPGAPKAESDEVLREAEAGGHDPHCRRHGDRVVVLRRRGKQFACPECGVVYGDAEP